MIRFFKRFLALLFCICILLGAFGFKARASFDNVSFKYNYGVFLSVGPESISKMRKYKTIVLDVQNDFSKKDISKLKKEGHEVYSYINVGALENYRDYYSDYEDVTLDVYENWPDERWVNVSSDKWQKFILNKLSRDIMKLGVDGFFVDNADVYYHYHTDEIYDGLTRILKGLKKKGKVIINGGDTYVSEYLKRNKNIKAILDGVNQESIFSRIIDYDNNKFGKNDKDTEKYYKKYLSKIKKNRKKVYLLEYTKNRKLKKKIKEYCKKKGYSYYISGSLDLS